MYERDLESANTELRAMNEELQAMAQELAMLKAQGRQASLPPRATPAVPGSRTARTGRPSSPSPAPPAHRPQRFEERVQVVVYRAAQQCIQLRGFRELLQLGPVPCLGGQGDALDLREKAGPDSLQKAHGGPDLLPCRGEGIFRS